MSYTVFYAWQMDRDKRVNRWFIHSAAETAIESVIADLELEDAPGMEASEQFAVDPDVQDQDIRLDHDTKNEPGTPQIAETILRKIENCGVFIADVTLVGEIITADGRTKKMPNANVMIELGVAIQTVGWERIVLVMNRAFGSAEDLPFDLKHRAIKVGYELDTPDDPDKSKKRKELAGALAEHLRELHRRGIITRKDEEQRRAKQEALDARSVKVEQERQQFEERVAANGYHGLKADAAVLAVSVIPADPVRLEFLRSQELTIRRFVQPINLDGCPVQIKSRSVTSLSHPLTTGLVQSRVAELLETGCFFSAWNIMSGQDSFTEALGPKVDVSKAWPLHIGGYDESVNDWVRRALGGMKELGIDGPWFVGISLLKARNCVLIPSRGWKTMFWPSAELACAEDGMIGETIRVPAGIDLTTRTALDQFLVRPWKQIWRCCGFNGVPKIDGFGDVISWQE